MASTLSWDTGKYNYVYNICCSYSMLCFAYNIFGILFSSTLNFIGSPIRICHMCFMLRWMIMLLSWLDFTKRGKLDGSVKGWSSFCRHMENRYLKDTNYYSACLAVAIVMFIYIYISLFYLFIYFVFRTKTTSMQLEQQLWPAYQCTSRRILQRFSKHARYFGITIICTFEFKKGWKEFISHLDLGWKLKTWSWMTYKLLSSLIWLPGWMKNEPSLST